MKKTIIKVVCFVAAGVLLFLSLNTFLSNAVDAQSTQAVKGFYDERENSLDAVYLGSSNCLAFWNPLLAWEKYGITVYAFANNSQPITAAEFMIKEARKTQKDAVFVININSLGDTVDIPTLHRLFDYLPLSKNKIEAIEKFSEMYGLTKAEKAEMYLPFIRYHSRWGELARRDWDFELTDWKGALNYTKYFRDYADVTEDYVITDGKAPLPQLVDESVNSLLNYCDSEKLKVVFVRVPRSENTQKENHMLVTLGETIKARGYEVLDLSDKADLLGLDLEKDYYNATHTNIHGSVKFTDYVAKYLVDTYGFENKKEDKAYADWNKAYTEYAELAMAGMLDFEFYPEKRTLQLEAPVVEGAFEVGKITLNWNAVDGADGYAVYERRGYMGQWKRIGETKGTQFIDKTYEQNTRYYYTVVPYVQKDGEKYYGDFSQKGFELISGKLPK